MPIPMVVAGIQRRGSRRRRLSRAWPVAMTSPATAPPVSADSGLSTRPTTAVPARPARGKARNPAVQINQARRNDGVDAAGPVMWRVMVGQLLGPAGAGCVGAGVRGIGSLRLSEADRLALGLRRRRMVRP